MPSALGTIRIATTISTAALLALPSGCDGEPTPENSVPNGTAVDKVSAGSWLVDVTDVAGLDFVHETGAMGQYLLPEIMAGGCALLDVDGDGDLDAYLTNGVWTDGRSEASPTNRLFLQVEPWRFVDATPTSGLGDTGYGMGVAAGDFDGDGRTDLYVCNAGIDDAGADRLYRNVTPADGASGPSFEDATTAAGIAVHGWSSSAAFVDYDADGDLDLLVVRYVHFDAARRCTDGAGRADYCGPKSFAPIPDMLWRNDGDGTFTDVSATSGIGAIAGPGLGLVCADLDGDELVDIYVANDGAANFLWRNRGNGTFEEIALLAGCAFNVHGQPEAGMGVVAEDFDGDGLTDLFVTHQARETNTFYRGHAGAFVDATGGIGLGATSLPATAFGTVGNDLDCDGMLDLLIVGGRVLRDDDSAADSVAPDRRRPSAPWSRYAESNQFYRGTSAGFVLDTSSAEAFTSPTEVSRGLAAGDLDGDGDLDLLVTNAHGAARLLRNDAPRSGHWLLVCPLEASGAPASGATVSIVAEGASITRRARSAYSYQSASAPVAHFGLGRTSVVDAIEIRWTDGTRERFQIDGVDRTVIARRGTGADP